MGKATKPQQQDNDMNNATDNMTSFALEALQNEARRRGISIEDQLADEARWAMEDSEDDE